LKKFYSLFHRISLYSSRAIRDTDPHTESAWAWILTKARGYSMYTHSACQWVPGSHARSPGPGSTEYRVSPIRHIEFILAYLLHYPKKPSSLLFWEDACAHAQWW